MAAAMDAVARGAAEDAAVLRRVFSELDKYRRSSECGA
jgi:hypothetical protein